MTDKTLTRDVHSAGLVFLGLALARVFGVSDTDVILSRRFVF